MKKKNSYICNAANASVSKRLFLKSCSIIMLIAFLNLISGCAYFQVKIFSPPTSAKVRELNELNSKKPYKQNHFILLHKDETYYLSIRNITKDTIYGKISQPTAAHIKYYDPELIPGKSYPFNPNYRDFLNEVAIHSINMIRTNNNEVKVPLASITKLEIIDPDSKKALVTYILLPLGILAGAFFLFIIIAILTKESCPYIYTWNGEQYVFEGEIYGGAIYPSLERHDYMKLEHIAADKNAYRLKITNELKEIQHTNLAELIRIEHPAETSALMDKNGYVHTCSNPVTPSKAIGKDNPGYVPLFQQKDSEYFMFAEDDTARLSSVELYFPRPENKETDTAKLIVNAKNSFWLEFVYEEFSSMFGKKYDRFTKHRNNIPPEDNYQWMKEEGLVLSVWLFTSNGWKCIDYFHTVGPLAARSMIMPLDITDAAGDDIRIKLESGFMFWDIDYAAMDFSQNTVIGTETISAISAIDEMGEDVLQSLLFDDDDYLVQPLIGNIANVTYPSLHYDKNLKQTLILHTKGHYQKLRDYKGRPDVKFLKTFRKPGTFAEYSKKRYREVYTEFAEGKIFSPIAEHHMTNQQINNEHKMP